MASTGYFTHSDCRKHDMGRGHPECPARLDAIEDRLLASGLRDAEFGTAFHALGEAMTGHPEMVSGTGRSDLAFMRAGRGDWVTKIGADGVQVVASKSRGEALALKIMDGNKPALYAATVEALDQLGWLDDAQRKELEPWRARVIVNARGLQVGERRPAFRLQAGD